MKAKYELLDHFKRVRGRIAADPSPIGGDGATMRTASMRPRIPQYWMAHCPTHGLTTFGHYYLTTEVLAVGCLHCHFEQPCMAHPTEGAPLHSELIADSMEQTSHT